MIKVGHCSTSATQKEKQNARMFFFSAFPQIEATLLRSAECEEVQRVAECCWHLAWRTSEPRRHLWQGHRRKHKWELMAPLFRVIRRARHHIFFSGTALLSAADVVCEERRKAMLKTCACVCRGGQKIEPRLMLLRHKLQLAHTM